MRLFEIDHKNGTYAMLEVEKDCAKHLHKWVEKNVENCNFDPADEYHCTIVYSRKPIPKLEDLEVALPITATIKEWKIFPSSGEDGINVLVAVLNSSTVMKLNAKITDDFGATSDFDKYIPHITIGKYTSETAPPKIPNIKISFDRFSVSALDAPK